MAIRVPPIQELIDSFTSTFESKIGQTVPTLERSFIGVLSRALAFSDLGLYKYAAGRAKQVLAITADGDNLETIGENYGRTRIAGTPAIVTATIGGQIGATIQVKDAFVGDNNGVRYFPEADVTFTSTSATINLVSEELGDTGNAVSGDTFTIVSPLLDVNTVATYSSMDTLGTDREDIEAYRRRVLDEIRTVGGGGNGVDYRRWGEEEGNVARIFPYSGKPVDGSLGTSEPGDRTIYVEAVSTYAPGDGTADEALLDDVRDLINTDPDTGFERIPLGMTDSTLFVLSITRSDVWVTITSLVSPTVDINEVKSQVEDALTDYLGELAPFVQGVDVDIDRNAVLTDLSLSRVVQQILANNGASAQAIEFSATEGGAATGSKTLAQGELVGLAGVAYD